MNQKFGLQFGPLTANVICETSLFEAFSFIYGHLILSVFQAPNLLIEYQSNHRVRYEITGHPEHQITVADNRQKIACFSALLLKALSTLHPNDLIFHGNALAHQSGSQGVIILGKSGLGKTTLSRILMAEHGYESFAEDLMITNPESGLATYPRAFGIRGETPTDARKFFGKVWERHPGNRSLKFPQHGKIIYLNLPEEEQRADEIGSTTWATSSQEFTLELLKKQGLPASSMTTENEIFRITYTELLTPSQRKIEHDVLTSAHSLIFQTSQGHSVISDVHARPSQPILRELNSHSGLEALTEHMILPTIESLQIPIGLRLLTAAKCFSHFQFLELIPGGTPHETVALMQEYLD